MMNSADSPPSNKAAKANRGMLAMVLGIMGGMVLVCVCLCGALGALYMREAPDASARLSVMDIRTSECFSDLPEGGGFHFIPLIACDEPHRYEAFAQPPLYSETGDFPGEETLAAYTERECAQLFEPYVGVVPARTPFTITTVQPDAGEWDRGQRRGLCLLSATDGSDLTEAQYDAQAFYTELPIIEAFVGECLRTTPDAAIVITIDCDESHDLEVYEVAPLDGDTYPGDEVVTAFANVRCASGFVDYVGAPINETALLSQSYQPSETQWAEGARQVVCVLSDATGASLESSMVDSGIMMGGESESEEAVVETPTIIRDLQVGDCYNDSDYYYELDGEVLVVDCDVSHYYELYHINTLPDAPVIDEEIIAAADVACVTALEAYIGLPYDDSSLDYEYIVPLPEEWADGERTYVCMVHGAEYTQLDEAVQDNGDGTSWAAMYEGSEQTPLAEMAVGDCYLDPKRDIFTFVITVPCDTYHHNEVFAIVESAASPDAPYPNEMTRLGDTLILCESSFESYVGLPYEESMLQMYTLIPTAEQWAEGARTYTCALYDEDYFFMQSSVANSGRATAYVLDDEIGERVPLTDVGVGNCINFPINYSKSQMVLVVPCTEEHTQEVFGRATYPNATAESPYPDYDDLDFEVATVCESAFTEYVGLPYGASTLDYTYLGISSEEWARGGREFICTLVDGSYMPLTQSQRDTGDATAYPPDDVPNAERVALTDLAVGDCYQQPADYYKSMQVLRVACTEPHSHEIYALSTYPDTTAETPYPNFDGLATFADSTCVIEFESYVGVSIMDSTLGYTYELPDLAMWAAGDREIPCILFSYYDDLDASMQGSQQ